MGKTTEALNEENPPRTAAACRNPYLRHLRPFVRGNFPLPDSGQIFFAKTGEAVDTASCLDGGPPPSRFAVMDVAQRLEVREVVLKRVAVYVVNL